MEGAEAPRRRCGAWARQTGEPSGLGEVQGGGDCGFSLGRGARKLGGGGAETAML